MTGRLEREGEAGQQNQSRIGPCSVAALGGVRGRGLAGGDGGGEGREMSGNGEVKMRRAEWLKLDYRNFFRQPSRGDRD